MLRAVISGRGAEAVYPVILCAVIDARLLAVPDHHDLCRTHPGLLFRRYRLSPPPWETSLGERNPLYSRFRFVEHLECAGFVAMKGPPIGGAGSLARGSDSR